MSKQLFTRIQHKKFESQKYLTIFSHGYMPVPAISPCTVDLTQQTHSLVFDSYITGTTFVFMLNFIKHLKDNLKFWKYMTSGDRFWNHQSAQQMERFNTRVLIFHILPNHFAPTEIKKQDNECKNLTIQFIKHFLQMTDDDAIQHVNGLWDVMNLVSKLHEWYESNEYETQYEPKQKDKIALELCTNLANRIALKVECLCCVCLFFTILLFC